MFQRALFIFRRDLRLEDNTALIHALETTKEVIPCFIFTPEQLEHNPYRSDFCLKFMIESLIDLNDALKQKGSHLTFFYDAPEKIVARCIRELKIDAVVVNQDYTAYSQARDLKIQQVCEKADISFISQEDALLHPILDTVKKDGKPYTIFTPYFRNASRFEVPHPARNTHRNYATCKIAFAEAESILHKLMPRLPYHSASVGGRTAALKILQELKSFADYESQRDFPALELTTHLSAHLKFTTCSIREAYYAIHKQLGGDSALLRSLYWRDFFTSIAFHFPYVFQQAFHQKFNLLKWDSDTTLFKRWCEGTTGFPIVDAGMRQMNQTGFMHNRVRMIVGSFLIKDLHIDWHWGEKYFANTLIDYDPAVNNGNWQWVASTGCDAQPYFRIFNPWSQQVKFDADCTYIKQWIPELKDVDNEVIHNWHKEGNWAACPNYPPPICEHSHESKITADRYRKAASAHA